MIIKYITPIKIVEFTSQLPDKRIDHKKLHSSKDIVFITIAAVVCGAQNWDDIEEFGHCKEEFFREILALPNGIPSHNTFNSFFACLSPEVLEQQFLYGYRPYVVKSFNWSV